MEELNEIDIKRLKSFLETWEMKIDGERVSKAIDIPEEMKIEYDDDTKEETKNLILMLIESGKKGINVHMDHTNISIEIIHQSNSQTNPIHHNTNIIIIKGDGIELGTDSILNSYFNTKIKYESLYDEIYDKAYSIESERRIKKSKRIFKEIAINTGLNRNMNLNELLKDKNT